MEYDDNIVNAVLTFPFDYIVMENEVYEENLDIHTEVLQRMVRVADNGTLSLFIYHTNEKP